MVNKSLRNGLIAAGIGAALVGGVYMRLSRPTFIDNTVNLGYYTQVEKDYLSFVEKRLKDINLITVSWPGFSSSSGCMPRNIVASSDSLTIEVGDLPPKEEFSDCVRKHYIKQLEGFIKCLEGVERGDEQEKMGFKSGNNKMSPRENIQAIEQIIADLKFYRSETRPSN